MHRVDGEKRVGGVMAMLENLPGTGRGTMRSMVEGSSRPANPSTAFGGPPPRAGEVL
jgi:hypothetical protein